MLRIAYMSRAREPLSSGTFEDIVATSAANNRRDGITGLLLCDGRRFLQAVEGGVDVVTACFERIAADERHHSVIELERNAIVERQFGDWSLRAFDLGVERAGFRGAVAAAVADVRDPQLRATFIGFATLAR